MDMLEHDGVEAQVEISLSIEETNKLRAQLGLKPLNLEKSQHEKKAEANYQVLMKESKKQKEALALKQKIEKSKIRQKLREKLKGPTLTTPDRSIDDTMSWIQRQKEKAKVVEAQFEETDLQSIQSVSSTTSSTSLKYDVKELEGLKVTHALNRFEEGKEFILTLKDKKILNDNKQKNKYSTSIDKLNNTHNIEELEEKDNDTDNDEEKDELENIDLLTKEKLELKAKALRGYNVFEDENDLNEVEQTEEGQKTSFILGKKNSTRPLLKKYDELSTGEAGFLLSKLGTPKVSSSLISSNINPSSSSSDNSSSFKPNSISLEFEKMNPIQDFDTPEEMPLLNKPKKRKRPLSMRKKNDASSSSSSLSSDLTPFSAESNLYTDVSTMNFVDDEDLQHTLLLARSKGSSKRSFPSSSSSSIPSFSHPTTFTDTSTLLTNSDPTKEVVMDNVGLVFDATTEFAHSITLANLAQVESGSEEEEKEKEQEEKEKERGREEANEKEQVHLKLKKQANVHGNLSDTLTPSHPSTLLSSTSKAEEIIGEFEGSNLVLPNKRKPSELESTVNSKRRKIHSNYEPNETRIDSDEDEEEDQIQQTMSEDDDENDKDEPAHPLQDEPDLNLGVGAALELFRKRGHLASADPEKLAREKEYMERLKWGLAHPTSKDKSKSAMKARIKDQVSKFKDYKPSINLDYVDEHGRALSTKEAYRQLSHRFHGRSSGKNKQEKLMRKEEERRRMLHMAGSDTPLQLASAMLEKQIALGTPGILLSVGNRPAPHESLTKK